MLLRYASGMPSIVKLLMKSRARRIPMKVQRLLEKRSDAISDEEALRAAERLTQMQKDQAQRYATGAGLGAATYPVVSFAGDAAKHTVRGLTQGGRVLPAVGRGLLTAAKDTLDPAELAKSVTKGLLTGSGVQALREHVSSLPDARTVEQYIAANRRTE